MLLPPDILHLFFFYIHAYIYIYTYTYMVGEGKGFLFFFCVGCLFVGCFWAGLGWTVMNFGCGRGEWKWNGMERMGLEWGKGGKGIWDIYIDFVGLELELFI
jgi:hypothetical protein